MADRLQKFLANIGLGSRREIETWIRAGRVMVDGAPATLGQRVSGTERIAIDGKPLRGQKRHVQPGPTVLAYNKPQGELCTRRDPEGRPTVFDALPRPPAGRWVTVGRLDVATTGLLLLTNDGALANALMHPSAELEREYAARVQGAVDAAKVDALLKGVELADGRASFGRVEAAGGEGSNRWYHVTVREGRNRLVRRLFEAVGCEVTRLIRIRYGPVALPRDLRRGRHRVLEPEQVAALQAAVAGRRQPDPASRRPVEG